jgi:DNA-binding beta-propeller fold protein YncE
VADFDPKPAGSFLFLCSQLNSPTDVYVSKKTGAMYISDGLNHRIQRWSRGATEGVTVAGSPSGKSRPHATMLHTPHSVLLNDDETKMYVSDQFNNRIQMFELI